MELDVLPCCMADTPCCFFPFPPGAIANVVQLIWQHSSYLLKEAMAANA